MTFFEWSDELSVGFNIIDSQHKELIKMINQFYDNIAKKSSRENLIELVKGLDDYTVFHFGTEEKMFEQFGYKDAVAHKNAHKIFVNKIHDVLEKLRHGKLVISFEITTFLKDWLKEHIMGTDRKYIACFKENGVE